MAFISVIVVCALQVRDARSGRGSGSLSSLSLGLQVIILLVLGLVQAFTPTFRYPRDWNGAWNWYLEFGNVAVHYVILALGQAVALGLRVDHSWHRSGEMCLGSA
jgi:hypothetical protein